jgi:hypothetical protein
VLIVTNDLEILRVHTLEDVETKQQRLRLPPEYVSGYPETHEAEFTFPSVTVIVMRMVDPASPAMAKRYNIARQNGSYAVSIPRIWLHDLSAKDGDKVELCQDASGGSDYLYLRFKRKDRS